MLNSLGTSEQICLFFMHCGYVEYEYIVQTKKNKTLSMWFSFALIHSCWYLGCNLFRLKPSCGDLYRTNSLKPQYMNTHFKANTLWRHSTQTHSHTHTHTLSHTHTQYYPLTHPFRPANTHTPTHIHPYRCSL